MLRSLALTELPRSGKGSRSRRAIAVVLLVSGAFLDDPSSSGVSQLTGKIREPRIGGAPHAGDFPKCPVRPHHYWDRLNGPKV